MIVAVMGTNGTGKSTLIRQLLEKSPARQELKDEYDEVAGYLLPEWGIVVVGPYPEDGKIVGGCDKIKGHPAPEKKTGKIERSMKGGIARVDELVRQYAPLGNVVFEGLLICYWKRWRAVSEAFPGRYVWAALDTPLEVCLQRIQERSERVYTEENLARLQLNVGTKFKDVQDIMRIAAANGERTVWLNHKDPMPQLLDLLTGGNPSLESSGKPVAAESDVTPDYRALSLF
jgi:hypothetical protein